MSIDPSKVLITGGAGFIGSHLVDSLMLQDHKVIVYDNLSKGSLRNIEDWLNNENFAFVEEDLIKPNNLAEAVKGVEIVFHLAANPEVRIGEISPSAHFQDIVATFNLLEALRKGSSAKIFTFFSTSTVYGESEIFPTPENYGPSIPISTYGASKLGCEALASSYAHTFGLRSLILRVANVVGSRAKQGIIVDFIEKLRKDSKRLEILGDGTQTKSYIYVEDLIDAATYATSRFLDGEKEVDLYNVGSVDNITVEKIAEIVAEEMGIRDVEFFFTEGVDGGRGWKGDVRSMRLSIDKLKKLGWEPKYTSEQAIRLSINGILREW